MKKILVIGDVFLDIFTYGTINRISPESHAPIFKIKKNESLLGGAGNVALNLCMQGCDVNLIGKVGNDNYGKFLKKKFKKDKIKFTNLGHIKTMVKQRFVTPYGQVLRVDDEEKIENNNIDYKKIKEVLNNQKFDGIYIADYDKGLIDLKLNKILNKNKNYKIFCDPKNKDLNIFKGFDFLKPNEHYINGHFKFNFKKNTDIKKIAELSTKYNIKNFVITLGENGSLLVNHKMKIFEKSKKVNFFDLSGAGDTFGATFFRLYIEKHITKKNLEKKNYSEILKISNFASSKVICKSGTSSISLQELNEKDKRVFHFGKDKSDILNYLKKQNGIIGYTNGCFDIFHAGHISLLKFAKSKCDFLICAINSDKSVKRLKGIKRPIVKENMRAELLINLPYVDLVIIFDEETPYKQIKLIKPKIIIKGSDYKKKDVIGVNLIKKYGGRIELAKIIENFSTSKIVKLNEKSFNTR